MDKKQKRKTELAFERLRKIDLQQQWIADAMRGVSCDEGASVKALLEVMDDCLRCADYGSVPSPEYAAAYEGFERVRARFHVDEAA